MLRYHFVSQVLSRDFCLGPIAGSLEMKDTVFASPRDKSPLVPFLGKKGSCGPREQKRQLPLFLSLSGNLALGTVCPKDE